MFWTDLFGGISEEGVTVLQVEVASGLAGQKRELRPLRVASGVGDATKSVRHVNLLRNKHCTLLQLRKCSDCPRRGLL